MLKRDSGFSTIELLIALAVISLILAVALPAFWVAMGSYRLTNAAANLASLIDLDRFTAIQRNNLIAVRQSNSANGLAFYIDSNSNGAMDPGEPRFLLPSDMQVVTPGGNIPGPSAPGFAYPTAVPLVSQTGTLTFDARGTLNYGAGSPVVYVIVLSSPSQPRSGYRAVTVTPMGQTKSWIWSPQQSGSGIWVAY